MIGLQDYVINNKISVIKLAEEIGIQPSAIWRWFKVNNVPKRYHEFLSYKFGFDKEYINKKVNDITIHNEKYKGFNDYKICGEYTEIYITNKEGLKFTVIVDTEDLPRLIQADHRWFVNGRPQVNWRYAKTTYYTKGDDGKKKGKVMRMHHFILDLHNSEIIDHINHNNLDNRKSNLRVIPHCNNETNRKSRNSNNSSGYRNVHWNTQRGMWMVQLQVDGKSKCFGYFTDAELDKAGKLAEELRTKYYGEFKGKN